MLMKFVIFMIFKFLVFASVQTHFPKVYEDLNDGFSSKSARQIRQLNEKSFNVKVHQPFSPFNYYSALQQDQRELRYILQKTAELQRKTVVIKSQLVNHKEGSNSKLYANRIEKNSHADILRNRNLNLQDKHSSGNKEIVYLDQEILKQNFGSDPKVAEEIILKSAPNNLPESEHDLHALHHLIGLNLNIQLNALQKLLQANFVEARVIPKSGIRDHTPITEETADVSEEQVVPVIIHSQARARAKQHALVHNEAQYKTIAKAKIDAEKKVLAQVAALNQAYRQPTQSFNVIQVPINYQEHHHHHHQEYQSLIPLSVKPEIQQPDSNVNYSPSNHQKPVLGHLQAHKAALALDNAFIYQKNQFFFKEIQSNPVLPNSYHKFEKREAQYHEKPMCDYQEVVLETQHQRRKIKTTYQAEEQKKLNPYHDQHKELKRSNCSKRFKKSLNHHHSSHTIKKRSNANDYQIESDDDAEYYDDDLNLNDTLEYDYYDDDSIQNSSSNFQKNFDSFTVSDNDSLVDMTENLVNTQPETSRRQRSKKRRPNRNRNRKHKPTTTKENNRNYDGNNDSRLKPLVDDDEQQLILSLPKSFGLGKKNYDAGNVIVINNSNQNYGTNSYLHHKDGHRHRNRAKHIPQRFRHPKRRHPNRRLQMKKIREITGRINFVLSKF